MRENNDKENIGKEPTEGEGTFVRILDNPSVSATEVAGTILVTSEEEGCPNLEQWAKDLPRDEPTIERVGLYLPDDLLTVAVAAGALEVSVLLSMIEEFILAYREENRTKIAMTS